MKPYQKARSRSPDASGPKEVRGGIIAFFNTAFGLWLLSSVFISGGSYIFTNWRDGRAAEAAKAERIERLDLEIHDRLENSARVLHGLVGDGSDTQETAREVAALPAHVFLPPTTGYDLYPEFRGRSLRSMVVELSSLVHGEEKRCIERALQNLRTAQGRWLGSPLPLEREAAFRDDIAKIAGFRWSFERNCAVS